MSVRGRAIVVIIAANLVIIIFSVFAGIGFASANIEKSIETDMSVVADIADHFVSSEIEGLKLKAGEAARSLSAAGENDWPQILAAEEQLYGEFTGMAVFDGERGLLVSAGEKPAPGGLINEDFMRRAGNGEKLISTSFPREGGVVFYLALPIEGFPGKILALTIPGTYFSELVSTFTVWDTGHIFIDDSDGYVIANIREEWVENRFNFVRMAEADAQYAGIAAVVGTMLKGETGIGRFSIAGVPRICAYQPIEGSAEGWCIGIIAPLPESPARDLDRGLLVVGLVAVFLNIIAAVIASNFIKKPFEEIAVLKEEAEANSRSKTNFLATMSHEMRTPLNAVIGLSELTMDGKIDQEAKENIEKIYTSGVTLLGIINDILDISKIESGKFELNPVYYDIPSLINDVITLNIMRIDEKPVTFKLFIDDTIPSRLYGDDLRIKQIFTNILSNAFKYTNAGTVEWHIDWEKSGGGVWLVSSVKDSGRGIRPEDISKLFINYSQVDRGSNRKIEGTGLGLALTKHMTSLMDGNVSVESEYGKGSTFTVRVKQGFVTDVPIGPAAAASLRDFRYIDQKKKRNAKLVRVHIPYARVLVVDDVPSNLTVVRGIMKPYGMKIDCASSGEEAIRLVRDGEKYNAIFMDHMMPEMDGMEAVRIIRNEIGTEYARTVPIIALTANAIRGNEEIFLNSGFQAFLSKPIDIVQMDAVIRQWVRNKELDREMTDGAAVEMETETETAGYGASGSGALTADNNGIGNGIDGLDLAKTLEQFGGDEESLAEVLRVYANQMPPMLEQLRSFSPDKLDGYIVVAHGIKGSSRSIYAERAGSLAESLERAAKAKDFGFLEKNNSLLIGETEKLIASIKDWLAKNDPGGVSNE